LAWILYINVKLWDLSVVIFSELVWHLLGHAQEVFLAQKGAGYRDAGAILAGSIHWNHDLWLFSVFIIFFVLVKLEKWRLFRK